jgi:hypothetical protein
LALVFGESFLPRSLCVRVRFVQLKQPGGYDHEVDSDQRWKDLDAQSVPEIVPEGHSSNDQKNDGESRAKPHSSGVSFELRCLRRVNDDEQRWVRAAGRVEDLKSYSRSAIDLLSTETLRFRQAVEQQTCRNFD